MEEIICSPERELQKRPIKVGRRTYLEKGQNLLIHARPEPDKILLPVHWGAPPVLMDIRNPLPIDEQILETIAQSRTMQLT